MQSPEQRTATESRPSEAVVVTPDGSRRALYRGALRMAGIPTVFPESSVEAESLIEGARPSVLVLDYGLPRAAVLQLYGMVRDRDETPPVPVLFVGQDGETEGDDHFLPGEPSPLAVAEQMGEIVSARRDAAESGRANGDAPAAAPRLVGARTSASRKPPAPAGPAQASAEPAVATAAPAPIQGRRLDVIMLRIGIVLFLLGVAVLFFRMESLPRALLPPPTQAPATPTPAPKPSGHLPGAPSWHGLALAGASEVALARPDAPAA